MFFCVILFFFITTSFAAGAEKNIEIFITGNLGEIYFPIDGKHPEVTESLEKTLTKFRKNNPSAIFIDTGNFSRPAFFNETSYTASPVRMFKALRYNAVALCENEMILGKEFIKKWHDYLGESLISNLLLQEKQEYILSPFRIISHNDLRIGILSVSNRILKGFLRNSLTPPENFVKDALKHISTLRKQSDLIILISDIDEKSLKSILDKENIPLVICTTRAKDKKSMTYKMNNSLVCKRFAPYSIGRLWVRYDTEKDTIRKYKYKEYKIKFEQFNLEKYKPWSADRKSPPDVPENWKSYIPEIGLQIDDITKLQRFGINSKVKGIISSELTPPGVLKSNKKVYAYLLENKEDTEEILYYCKYNAGYGGAVFMFYIVFSGDNTVKFFRALLPPTLGGNILDMEMFYSSLIGKKIREWQPPTPMEGVAGFYQKLFINLLYAVDEINTAIRQEFP